MALPGLAAVRLSRAAGLAAAAPAARERGRRGVRGRGAGVADRHAAVPRTRSPVRDRLDQRQRVERRVRVQRQRPPRREIAGTAAHRLSKPATATRWPRRSERDHIPIVPPSPTRLLARVGPLSGERLGLELLVALLLGIPALIWGLRTAASRPDGQAPAAASRRGAATAHAPRGGGRAGAVDARGHRAVQPHGAPAPALRRRLHAGGRGDARDRPRMGAREAGRGADRARCRQRTGRRACAWRCWWRRSRSSSTTPSACSTGPPGVVGHARWRRSARSRCALLARVPRLPSSAALAAGAGRRDGAGARGGARDPAESRPDGDHRPRQRRGPVGAAAGRPAASAERLPARPPGRRALRGGGRVGHRDRLADRAGRSPGARPDHLRCARLHRGDQAGAADRTRARCATPS